ncbi:MAG: hypothetical protein WA004_08540 [Saprospiraceae bacterium]
MRYLSIAFLFFLLSCWSNTGRNSGKCSVDTSIDTIFIPRENGIEDFEKFKVEFLENLDFQLARVNFSKIERPSSAWESQRFSPCTWRDLSYYYKDTIAFSVERQGPDIRGPEVISEYIIKKGVDNSLPEVVLFYRRYNGKWYLDSLRILN